MTISRANIATYLATQFSGLAAAIGQASSPEGGYSADIDNAFRKLGKTESELAAATAEDSQRDAVFALSEYYAAQRLWRQLGQRVNTKTGQNAYDFADQLRTAKSIMDNATSLCAQLGYPVIAVKRASFQVY